MTTETVINNCENMSKPFAVLNNTIIENYKQHAVDHSLYEYNKHKLVINDEPQIRIYQKIIGIPTTTTTAAPAAIEKKAVGEEGKEEEEEQQGDDNYNKMSLISQATVASQKSNNNIKINTNHNNNDDDISRKIMIETGCTVTNINTNTAENVIEPTTNTKENQMQNCIKSTTTIIEYPSLLLKVGNVTTATSTIISDVNKSKEIPKTVATTTINVGSSLLSANDHELNDSNYIVNNKEMHKNDNGNDNDVDDDDDVYIHLSDHQYNKAESVNGICSNNKHDNDEKSMNSNNNKSNNNNTNNGQTLYECMRDLNVQSQLHHQRLEKVCYDEQAVSLISKADCISGAVFECKNKSVVEDSGNLHVVKIHIQSYPEPKLQQRQLENFKQLNSVQQKHQEQHKVTDKQVTIVKLNNETENDYFDLIAAHANSDLQLGIDKMVHKTQIKNNDLVEVGAVTAGGTSVTELNVNNPNYLYYMMSSGQFSPCETLDSGTGSDLESNGHISNVNSIPIPKETLKHLGNVPKMELHLKTNKIRVNNNAKSLEHQRASSLTDSEESEASSLSCDSLHSAEFTRHPLTQNSNAIKINKNPNRFGTLLPDSLLRDIRDRATQQTDFIDICHTPELLNEQEYVEVKTNKIIPEHNLTIQTSAKSSKRASMPSKTFVINQEKGIFEDTKMNSMPRKYEADKYYDFHVKEHENFHSFNIKNDEDHSENDDSLKEFNYDNKSLRDECFAGFKDIRCSSATSTIRSSKGTVRGVKNRVRNGIATFLQLQQPNVKVNFFYFLFPVDEILITKLVLERIICSFLEHCRNLLDLSRCIHENIMYCFILFERLGIIVQAFWLNVFHASTHIFLWYKHIYVHRFMHEKASSIVMNNTKLYCYFNSV